MVAISPDTVMLSLMNKYRKLCFKLVLAEGDAAKALACIELRKAFEEVGKGEATKDWTQEQMLNFATNYIVSHNYDGLFFPPKNN